MTFVWMFPHEEGSKLDSTWVKMLQLPQLTAAQPVGGKMEPPPSLRPLKFVSAASVQTHLSRRLLTNTVCYSLLLLQ